MRSAAAPGWPCPQRHPQPLRRAAAGCALFASLLVLSQQAAHAEAAEPEASTRKELNGFVRRAARLGRRCVVRVDVQPSRTEEELAAEAAVRRRRQLLRLMHLDFAKKTDEASPQPRQGSGFGVSCTDADGIEFVGVATAAHLVRGAASVSVELPSGASVAAMLVGADSVSDVALLRLTEEVECLHAAPLGNSDLLEAGDAACVVSCPLGLGQSVTLGVLSHVRRLAADVGLHEALGTVLQTDAPFNQGSSGGPLFDELGCVVGMCIAVRPDAEGIGFAVPACTVDFVLKQLAARGRAAHPCFGLKLEPGTRITVAELQAGSSAERAGVRPGDRLLSLDGKELCCSANAAVLLRRCSVGQPITLALRRGDVEKVLVFSPDEVQDGG